MAKKQKPVATAAPVQKTTNVSKASTINWANNIAIAVCLLYFVVHFIPDFGAYDNFGPQWLYIVILDMLITIGILIKKDSLHEATTAVFGNLFSKLYLGFFVIAGLSIITAINPTEGWVCFVRIIATVVAFFNLSILLFNKLDTFKYVAQLLAVILFIESCQSIYQFLNNESSLSYTDLINSLKGTTGNKNIFAASTIVKIPFVFYCIYRSKLLGKLANILILISASLTIFLVNARASYLSLIFITVLYIIFLVLNFLKEKKIESFMYGISYAVIPIMFSLFVSQILITNAKTLMQDKGSFGTVADRLGSAAKFDAEDNQIRIRLWKHAIDYTKHHPIIGTGVGNWKIASIPYQKAYTNDLIVPVHSHNDYLEQFAELGIIGGLLYLSLFFCITFFSFKTWRSNADEETKLIAVFTFLAFLGYSIDAFFNFPIERPINQVFFAFLTAFNVIAFIKSREIETESNQRPIKVFLKPLFGLIALIMLVPSLYITYITYKSLIIQKNVLGDLNNEPLKLDWKEITTTLPNIPNLSATGQPIEAIKGRYVYEAGNFEDALVLLDKGRSANPVIGYSEFLKAGVYFKQGKYDSAKRNAITAFYIRPRAKTYFQTLIAILAHLKDTSEIKRAYNEAIHYRNEPYVWNLYLQGMINSKGKGTLQLLKIVDSSLAKFPGDSTLLVRKNEIVRFMESSGTAAASNAIAIDYAASQKYYAQGVAAFGKGVAGQDDLEKAAGYFLKAAAINPADYTTLENAAICYFNLKNWNKSIEIFNREMAMVVSTTGKPEYFKGIALINIGQKEQGCSLLKVALIKGWKDAEGIINGNCK